MLKDSSQSRSHSRAVNSTENSARKRRKVPSQDSLVGHQNQNNSENNSLGDSNRISSLKSVAGGNGDVPEMKQHQQQSLLTSGAHVSMGSGVLSEQDYAFQLANLQKMHRPEIQNRLPRMSGPTVASHSNTSGTEEPNPSIQNLVSFAQHLPPFSSDLQQQQHSMAAAAAAVARCQYQHLLHSQQTLLAQSLKNISPSTTTLPQTLGGQGQSLQSQLPGATVTTASAKDGVVIKSNTSKEETKRREDDDNIERNNNRTNNNNANEMSNEGFFPSTTLNPILLDVNNNSNVLLVPPSNHTQYGLSNLLQTDFHPNTLS